LNKSILTRPFPPEQIKQRPGQHGKMLSYIETHAVIARLNEGCDAWSFEIVRHEIHEAEVVVLGKLTADGVVKTAFGGSAITRGQDGEPVSLADDLKAGASDCLKKAASLLGVGLELYGGGRHGENNGSGNGQSNGVRRANGNGAGAVGGHSAASGDRLTARQLAAIHGAARRANVSRENLMLLVKNKGKKQLEALTKGEASEIIFELSATNAANA
jgi:hypothetical protein